jgi:hypothetical protein
VCQSQRKCDSESQCVCVCVCLCVFVCVCVWRARARLRVCICSVSLPPQHTVVPGFSLVLPASPTSLAASAKRPSDTPACKSAKDRSARRPSLPPPASSSLLAGDLNMSSVSTNCRCADAVSPEVDRFSTPYCRGLL